MSRPEVPQRFGAFRLLRMRDSVTPENVEAAFRVLQFFEQRMKAILQRVRLQELTPVEEIGGPLRNSR